MVRLLLCTCYLFDRGGHSRLPVDRKPAVRFFDNLVVGRIALEDHAYDVTLALFALAEHVVPVFISDHLCVVRRSASINNPNCQNTMVGFVGARSPRKAAASSGQRPLGKSSTKVPHVIAKSHARGGASYVQLRLS